MPSTAATAPGTRDPQVAEVLGGRLPQPVRRVLVVDDEADIRSSLGMYLEGCLSGVRVLEAASAEAALEHLEAEHIDLVVSDYKMPGKTGLELLAECQQRWPGTRRILVTAFPDLDVAVAAVNDGRVDRFLPKPLDPVKMVELVYDLLQEHRVERERQEAYRRALDILRRGERGGPGADLGPDLDLDLDPDLDPEAAGG